MNRAKNIPSPEEFERASRKMEERSRGLEQVRTQVLAKYVTRGDLIDFYILDQIDVDFRAYVFFRRDNDIPVAHETGLVKEIVDFVFKALEDAGRGRRGEIETAFEFDSHEHVQAAFEGDYSLRLRA